MKKRRLVLAGAVLLAAAVLAVALFLIKGRGKPSLAGIVRNPAADVILITLDTTRPDRLGCYGYASAKTPEIDRFAREGALFKNAYSPVPLTLPAHSSIMTGTYPPFHGVRTNGKYMLGPAPVTLAETLKEAGYATAAFVSSFVLDSRFGMDQGFDYFGDSMEAPAKLKNLDSERRAGAVVKDFESWLARRPDGKFFAWIHFYDPHAPYDPPEPFCSDPSFSHPYDGEIASMDAAIGRVRQLVESLNSRRGVLWILAGDHGEAFGEHKEMNGHTFFAYEENIRVPLILSSPGGLLTGREVPTMANLVDVAPTVLDYLEIAAPASIQGESLLPAIAGRKTAPRAFYFETLFPQETLGCAPLTGILVDGHKYIQLPVPELYDLVSDPAESDNLAPAREADIPRWADRLAETAAAIGSGTDAGRPMTAEERRKLASLGYVTDSGKRPGGDPAPDPKDKIDFWNRALEAEKALAEDRRADAEAQLRALFEEDPLFKPVVEDLGELYDRKGDAASLAAVFDKAIGFQPESAALAIAYGRHLVRLGRPDRAVAVLRAAETFLSLEEREPFYFILGSAFGRLERHEEAARCFQEAIEIEPENFEAARLRGYALLQIGRYDEALEALRTAEKGLPDNPGLFEDMAMTLANLKDFKGALAYFEKAVRLNPSARIFANYALAFAELKDYQKASETMRKALAAKGLDGALRAEAESYLRDWALIIRSRR